MSNELENQNLEQPVENGGYAGDAPVEDAQFRPAEEEGSQEEVEITAEVHVQVNSKGEINLVIPEGGKDLEPRYVESLFKEVYDNLFEQRITQNTFEVLKQRLG